MALKSSNNKKQLKFLKTFKKSRNVKHKTVNVVSENNSKALQKVANFCLMKSDGIQQN